MIDPETIAKLRELEASATKGPWQKQEPWCSDDGEWAAHGPVHAQVYEELDPDSSAGKQASADSALIAEMRNALPALLDELELLREREAKMKRALQFYAEQMHFDCYEDMDGETDIDLVDDGLCARTTLAELYPED